MSEHPILFNSEMVRAVLSGRKTQTRRVIKNQPPWESPIVEPSYGAGVWGHKKGIDWADPEEPTWRCPYGVPGQRLWVRETWRPSFWDENFDVIAVEYRADGTASGEILTDALWVNDDRRESAWESLTDELEKSNCPTDHNGNFDWSEAGNPIKWRPSIFMPRAACRIELEILNVRVERLQAISSNDAIAEGVTFDQYEIPPSPCDEIRALNAYRDLWDSINGKRGLGWDVDPWLWVIEFKKAEAIAQ